MINPIGSQIGVRLVFCYAYPADEFEEPFEELLLAYNAVAVGVEHREELVDLRASRVSDEAASDTRSVPPSQAPSIHKNRVYRRNRSELHLSVGHTEIRQARGELQLREDTIAVGIDGVEDNERFVGHGVERSSTQ